MENSITVLGHTNPEKLTSDDLSILVEEGVAHVSYNIDDDAPVPKKFTALFVEDQVSKNSYLRIYRATIDAEETKQDAIDIMVIVIRSLFSKALLINVGLDIMTPSEREERKKKPTLAEINMAVAEEEFIAEQLDGKIEELFPYLSEAQVVDVRELLVQDMYKGYGRPDDILLHLLHSYGISEDTPIDIFKTMTNDVLCALAGLGIDIVEPGASVKWTC